MKKGKGRSRVVIEQVAPEIDGGMFPAKRVIGESFRVSADLLGDGHDVVNGEILYRLKGKRKWWSAPMKFIGDDRWTGAFIVASKGVYEYTVHGWIDHVLTWRHDIDKKIEAGQHVDVELQAGAGWLKMLVTYATKKEAAFLKSTVKLFLDSKRYSKAIAQALSKKLETIIEKYPLRTHATQYHRILQVEVDQPKALFSTWYEFFPRSTASEVGRHGTFRDCERVLPIIARMGFDVVYFPPIHPIGEAHRKGKNNSTVSKPGEPGSPWAIGSKDGGHKSIHKALGTMEDFQHLVEVARNNNIDIALDLAYQCSPDHPYVEEHPEWFKWRPDGTIQYAENPPKKYQDVLPLNFESPQWRELWNELKDIVLFWIDRGVTIFRVDNPHTKPFDFWEWLIAEVRKDHPDVIFLAEAFTRHKIMARLAKIGFTQSYTYFSWKQHKGELVEYILDLTQTESRDYFRPNFWPNTPDINPYYLQNTGFTDSAIRLILAATLSSSYGMYGPVFDFLENQPLMGKEEYFDSEKYEIRKWDWEKWTPFRELISRINRIRRENIALQSTFNIEICATDNDQILSYCKADENMSNIMYIAVNLDPNNVQRCMTRLPLEFLGVAPGQPLIMHDLLTDARYYWHSEWNYVELRPNELPAHIFRVSLG